MIFIESFGDNFDISFNENMKVTVRGSAEIRVGECTVAEIRLVENKGYTWMYLDTKMTEDGKEIVVIKDLEEGELEIEMVGRELVIRKLDFEIKFRVDKLAKEYFEMKREVVA